MKTPKEIIDRIETRIHDLEHEIYRDAFDGMQCSIKNALTSVKNELTNLANWIEDNEVPPK